MNEVNKKIEELRNKISMLEREIADLEEQNSNWYIGMYSIGDGDYWDEYYVRLGYITEDRAIAWVDKTRNNEYDEVYEAHYFPVDKERYDKFGDWCNLDRLLKDINTYSPAIRNLKGAIEFKATVDKAIQDLAKEIGIRYLSYMHPANY